MRDCIPASWEVAKIGQLVDRLQYGYTAKAKSAKPGPRFLRITDIEDGRINWASVPGCRISEGALAKYELADGDIVFARTGSIEKACVVVQPPEAVFASYLIRGKPLLRDLSAWLHHFLQSLSYRQQALQGSAGIGRANINAKSIGEIILPVAPLPEQRRIVHAIESYLTRLDAAVASLERVQHSLKRYRASVLKAAVEGRLVPTEAELAKKEGRSYEPASELLKRILIERREKWIENAAEKARAKAEEKARKAGKPWTQADDIKTLEKERAKAAKKYKEPVAPDSTDLPDLPEGWYWVTLESLCISVTDGDHAAPPQVSEGIPFLVISNVRNGSIAFNDTRHVPQEYYAGLDNARRPQRGDILYTVTGSFGIPVYVDSDRPFCVQRHIGILKPVPSTNPRFLSRILASDFVYRQALDTATGTAQKTLGLKLLRQFVIPLPPEHEQVRILKTVEMADSVASHALRAARHETRKAETLRQSILKWAFEGKLVLQDPNDLPASVLLERIKAERESMQPSKKRRSNKKRQPAKHDKQLDLLGGSNK